MMSSGLACDQLLGSTAFSPSSVAGDNVARVTPMCSAASAAMTPAPPPLVTISNASAWLVRKRVSVSAARNSCCSVSTRNMPARAIAASYARSDPARAPVCEAAALAPRSDLPALTTMTGLLRAAARAADMNLRGDVTDSM